jgi:hypothetical protein
MIRTEPSYTIDMDDLPPPPTFHADAIDLSHDATPDGYELVVMRVYTCIGARMDVVMPREHVRSFATALAAYGS